MKNAIKLFEISGTPVYLKYWFLLLFLFLSIEMVISVFIAVMVHEIAHAVVAKNLGYKVNRIFLDIFHGAAEIDKMSELNNSHIVKIVAAGPISNFALVILSLVVVALTPYSAWLVISNFMTNFIAINILLGVFNLLPIFPLDGGRISKALFSMYLGKKGQMYSGVLSMVFSVALLAWSIFTLQYIVILFSVFFIMFSYYEITGPNKLSSIEDI